MKQRLLCICWGVIIFFASQAHAQTPFFNIYGSPSGDDGRKVIEVPGTGTLVGGRTDDASGWSDVVFTRIDANGNLWWSTTVGTQDDEQLSAIVLNPLGGFYGLLTTQNPTSSPGYISTVVVKLDANGAFLWSKKFYETGDTKGTDIVATASGGCTFAAMFDSLSASNTPHLQLTSCDASGAVLWSNVYTTNVMQLASSVWPVCMTTAPNGDYILGLTYGQTFTLQQVVRISSAGIWLWGMHIYQNGDEVVDINFSPDRMELLTYNHTLHQARILYCDEDYAWPVWVQTIPLDTIGSDRMIACDYLNGHIAIAGCHVDTNNSPHNFIMQFDTLGNVISTGEVPYSFSDAHYLQNGDFVVTGTMQGAHFGPSDTASMYVSQGNLALQTMCNYTPVTISVVSGGEGPNAFNCLSYAWGNVANSILNTSTGTQVLPGCFTAIEEQEQQEVQIFPNPANDAVNLSFAQSETRTITVFNAVGEVVTQISSANNFVTISTAAWSTGAYLVRVSGASGNSMERISVVH